MPDYTDKANVMRVHWKRGRDHFSSFYSMLEEVRREIGDENLATWCFNELRIGLTIVNRVSDVLRENDARIARDNLAAARRAEQDRRRLQREEEERQRAARQAERTAQQNRRQEQEAQNLVRRDIEQRAAEINVYIDEHPRQASRTIAAALGVREDAVAEVRRQRERQRENVNRQRRRVQMATERPAPPAQEIQPTDRSLLTNLAPKIRASLARVNQSRQDWVEATLVLAQALSEARNQFSINQEFSTWLGNEQLDIGSNDRAALINMAAHLEIVREVLSQTERWSWRLIWLEEVQPRLHSAVNTTSENTEQNQGLTVH
jgi:hypothetical protein